MKTFIILGLMAFSSTIALSQQGNIQIEQDHRIGELLNIYKLSNESHEYYKIQIGFGSYAEAQELKENVENDFPDLFSKIDFDSPTYRVRVGRFKTKLEAERKFIEVRAKYPDAMLLKPKKST
ncbi:SPOR domain-containing protein [Maribacter polysaccharolyticus]|uniref:SPOR domain-containing protein n=1 Tax=Maribacter polysaccharolyticus TaxID=3020831 RepID=UPI00237F7F1F|nr:SPOR domain-containing protein [Maribacter polysaccharolyticus]MDE3741413.1 SPOR domain-containing protein [Maribacter polysaccharolyticus]